MLEENVFRTLNTRETCDSWNANKGTNQCSSDMNNYCIWHKMADVRWVKNRKRSFLFSTRILFCMDFWSVLDHNSTACMYREEMSFVKMFFIRLPGETSAFLAILYYLWMFICCSIGVPPWNGALMKYGLILVGVFSIRRVQLGYAFDDHLLASFISPWLLFNSVYSY